MTRTLPETTNGAPPAPSAPPALDAGAGVALVRRQFKALNAGDYDGALATWAWELGPRNHGMPATPEIVRWIYTDIHEALEERFSEEDLFAVGDRVVLRATVRGRHVGVVRSPVNGGVLTGLDPSGRSYTVQHIHIFQLAGDRLLAHWANRDDLGMMQQLGMLPTPELPPPPGLPPGMSRGR